MDSVHVRVGKDMKFKFHYQTEATDIWKLSMYGIYSSMLGMVNIIFTAAMFLLTVKFWSSENIFIKILLIIAASLFTVVQPLAIYMRAKRQTETFPQDMEIGFDDKGIHVITSAGNSDLKWSMIRGVTQKNSMIIIYTTDKHGFVLTNKTLGKQKEDFYKYAASKIKE